MVVHIVQPERAAARRVSSPDLGRLLTRAPAYYLITLFQYYIVSFTKITTNRNITDQSMLGGRFIYLLLSLACFLTDIACQTIYQSGKVFEKTLLRISHQRPVAKNRPRQPLQRNLCIL